MVDPISTLTLVISSTYNLFILVIILIILLTVVINALNSESFLRNEDAFDLTYLKKRKRFPLMLRNVIYPFSLRRTNKEILSLHMGLINSIYNDIKDFNNPLSKRLFGIDLEDLEKVKNILKAIPEVQFLSLGEYKEIKAMITRIGKKEIDLLYSNETYKGSDESGINKFINPIPVISSLPIGCIKHLFKSLSIALNINLCLVLERKRPLIGIRGIPYYLEEEKFSFKVQRPLKDLTFNLING